MVIDAKSCDQESVVVNRCWNANVRLNGYALQNKCYIATVLAPF
jgi:hypothetical protein